MYTTVIKLNDEKFRRKTGVKKHTFEVMVKFVRESEQARKKLSGRPNKLCYEDQVLMTLEYLREYRTYFSIGEIYEVSEANAYKIIKRTEDILIQAQEFKLPSRKEMYEDLDIQVVVVDASESAIARKRSTPLKFR
jgi:predicted DNA-binding protein YlxM (UPF0122 family)